MESLSTMYSRTHEHTYKVLDFCSGSRPNRKVIKRKDVVIPASWFSAGGGLASAEGPCEVCAASGYVASHDLQVRNTLREMRFNISNKRGFGFLASLWPHEVLENGAFDKCRGTAVTLKAVESVSYTHLFNCRIFFRLHGMINH